MSTHNIGSNEEICQIISQLFSSTRFTVSSQLRLKPDSPARVMIFLVPEFKEIMQASGCTD